MAHQSDDLEGIHRLARAEVLPPKIGRYVVLEKLGQGGMGKVYKGYDDSLERPVAIKVLTEEEGEATGKAILKEAQLSARLQHPNIVTVYEVVVDVPQPYIAMEYIAGCSLARYFKETKPPIELSLQLLHKIAMAIYHAHRQGIIHRDLKPANIMIASRGEPKVMDFGLAKMMNADTSVSSYGLIIGTPAYIPPEQMSGDVKHIDARSDVYGLGAIFYEMLTGRPPFVADNLMDLALMVMQRRPQPPMALNAAVSKEIGAICLKCLEKNPQKRYQTAYALAQDLERYMKAEPITIYVGAQGYRVSKWLQRHWRWSVATLVGLTMLLAVSLSTNWWLYQLWRKTSQTRSPKSSVAQQPTPKSTITTAPATSNNPQLGKTNPPSPIPAPLNLDENSAFLPIIFADIADAVRAKRPYTEVVAKFLVLQKLLAGLPFFHQQWGKCAFIYALREPDRLKRDQLLSDGLARVSEALRLAPDDGSTMRLGYQICQKGSGEQWRSWQKQYAERLGKRTDCYRLYAKASEIVAEHKVNRYAPEDLSRLLTELENYAGADRNEWLESVELYTLSGWLYLYQEQWPHALSHCERAMAIAGRQAAPEVATTSKLADWLPNPLYGELLNLRGQIYFYQKAFENALTCYNLALQESVGNVAIYLSRAECYRSCKKYDKVIADLEPVIADKLHLGWAYLLRSEAQLQLKNHALALSDAEQAILATPGQLDGYTNRIQVYLEMGKHDDAMQDLLKAMAISPNNPRLYLMRANLYSLMQQPQKALEDVQTAARLPH